jgi:hypothetical protein
MLLSCALLACCALVLGCWIAQEFKGVLLFAFIGMLIGMVMLNRDSEPPDGLV